MRIIGGLFKGRRFYPPADSWPTRPTTDYAKEGLFNILYNRYEFDEMRVLDLFGGTGSHSYEWISRGCTDVTYVDKFAPCIEFVKKTSATLKIEDNLHIVKSDVFHFIEKNRETFDYIFAGPPYGLPNLDTIPDKIFELPMLKPNGILVLEHNPHHNFKDQPRFTEARNYGKTIFSFFEQPAE